MTAASALNYKPLPAAPFQLEGKRASEPAIVRWVARNIDAPNPDPAECPDPFAWTLLKRCREEPGFIGDFIDKLWVKLIPSRSQLDQGNRAVMDGKPTIDLIDKIRSMRDDAQEVADRAAEPDESPEAFESFDPQEDE